MTTAKNDTKPGKGTTEKGTVKTKLDATQEKLAELQAQLDALRSDREDGAETPPAQDTDTAQAGNAAGNWDQPEHPDIGVPPKTDTSAQLQGFIEELDKELKETKPTTLLGVFALGILIGRLLPR